MRILSFFLLLLSVSCSSVWYDYRELEVEGLSSGAVWEISQNALEATLGVPLDKAHTDRGMRTMETKWRTQAQPFRKGERRRGGIEIVMGDVEKRTMTIRYYIEMQYNKTIGSEFDPKEEDWSGAGQDEDLQEHLRYRLRLAIAQAQGKRAPTAEGIEIKDPMKVDREKRR
jgi:hypothetical protein